MTKDWLRLDQGEARNQDAGGRVSGLAGPAGKTQHLRVASCRSPGLEVQLPLTNPTNNTFTGNCLGAADRAECRDPHAARHLWPCALQVGDRPAVESR